MRRLFPITSSLLLIVLISFAGCTWDASRQPNVVVVAVDNLNSSQITCSEDILSTGGAFSTLCQETVRFTHAYTPSTLSTATMASVLTGLYPIEHGLRHNGSTALPAEIKTLPELAVLQGYRTAFYSGGAPVLRKSGLDQGFEVFEDNITPSLEKPYRPFAENIGYFERWIRNSKNTPFFTVFYVPDLNFVNTQTVNRFGEPRNLSYNSQLQELDESLDELIDFLKARGRWDNTVFVFMGLNGKSAIHRGEKIDAINLFSENTQVTLLAKPVRKKRDLGLHWKIDRNVSLVDVGRTLAEAIGVDLPKAGNKDFKAISFFQSLGGEDPTWKPDRLIFIESAWASWKGVGGTRWAARKDHWLFLHDEEPKVFNTLLDRMEIAPVSLSEDRARQVVIEMLSVFSKYNLLTWQPLPPGLSEKFEIARKRWMPQYFESPQVLGEITRLYDRGFIDSQLISWWADLSLKIGNWKELKKVSEISRVDSWRKVASAHLDEKNVKFTDSCLSTLNREMEEAEVFRSCDDRLFLQLREWIVRRPGTKEEERAREEFLRSYRWSMVEQRLAELNQAMGGVWDISLQKPDGPSRIELTLALPKYQRYRRITLLRLGM